MPVPSSPNARLFYRAAMQRLEDAEFLLASERTTAAVYLAGYGVECILKSLLVSVVPRSQEDELLAMFRGARAHDFDWLRRQYRQRGGPGEPRLTAEHFIRLASWSTELRYSPRSISLRESRTFLDSAAAVTLWAEGRIT